MFDDSPWENTDPALWSMGELTSGLTCVCLPTLRPLVVRHFPSLEWHAGQSPRGQSGVRWYANRQGNEGVVADVESAACRTHSPRTQEDTSLYTRVSEIELREHTDSSDMHLIRKSNGGSGSGRVGNAGLGLENCVLPASPGKAYGKWSMGRP